MILGQTTVLMAQPPALADDQLPVFPENFHPHCLVDIQELEPPAKRQKGSGMQMTQMPLVES